jgi:hypothetical protein
MTFIDAGGTMAYNQPINQSTNSIALPLDQDMIHWMFTPQLGPKEKRKL